MMTQNRNFNSSGRNFAQQHASKCDFLALEPTGKINVKLPYAKNAQTLKKSPDPPKKNC